MAHFRLVLVEDLSPKTPEHRLKSKETKTDVGAELIGPPVTVEVFREFLRDNTELVPGPILGGIRDPRIIEQILVVENHHGVAVPRQSALEAAVIEAFEAGGKVSALIVGIPLILGGVEIAHICRERTLKVVTFALDVRPKVFEVSPNAIGGENLVVHQDDVGSLFGDNLKLKLPPVVADYPLLLDGDPRILLLEHVTDTAEHVVVFEIRQ